MVFVYPTETSYGIGCDARDVTSVKKIFAIKGRAVQKSVPLIAASQKMVEKFINARDARHPEIKKAMRDFWPGALTLVLATNAYARKILAPQTIAIDGTIAIRVPVSDTAREISQALGVPIVSTSANKSGRPACYSAAAVRRAFQKSTVQPDVLIDGGTLRRSKPSTIAEFKNGAWIIHRAGPVKL